MVGRRSSVRPDPEVLEDQAVQKNPGALVALVALVALEVQWSSVALMAQKALVAQVVAQWEVVLLSLASYCTWWGSQI